VPQPAGAAEKGMEDTTGGSLPWPWQLASLTPGAGYHTFGTPAARSPSMTTSVRGKQ